jgi:hypothetical protein
MTEGFTGGILSSDVETEASVVATSNDRGTTRGSQCCGDMGRHEVQTVIRYYTARSLGWEVWCQGGQEPLASFTFWDDADKWGRLNIPTVYEVKASDSRHQLSETHQPTSSHRLGR